MALGPGALPVFFALCCVIRGQTRPLLFGGVLCACAPAHKKLSDLTSSVKLSRRSLGESIALLYVPSLTRLCTTWDGAQRCLELMLTC